MCKIALLTIIVIVSSSSVDKYLPSNFPRCYRDWPTEKFDDCAKKLVETIQPMLRVGIKKLGFPSLKPLVFPNVTLEQEGNTATFKAFVTNFAIHGFDNYKIQKAHFDFLTHYAVGELDFPEIFVTGIYHFDGKLFQVPLMGQGDFRANITSNTHAVFEVWSKEEIRDGVTYLHHFKYKTHLELGKISSHSVEGLFKDNEVLAKATKSTIKNNIAEIVDTLKPAIEEVITSLFQNVYFKKLDTIPYDILFPISQK